MSSLWEYFDLQGPSHKKSLYTVQTDPEKSRDFDQLKILGSRDPARAWWPISTTFITIKEILNLVQVAAEPKL